METFSATSEILAAGMVEMSPIWKKSKNSRLRVRFLPHLNQSGFSSLSRCLVCWSVELGLKLAILPGPRVLTGSQLVLKSLRALTKYSTFTFPICSAKELSGSGRHWAGSTPDCCISKSASSLAKKNIPIPGGLIVASARVPGAPHHSPGNRCLTKHCSRYFHSCQRGRSHRSPKGLMAVGTRGATTDNGGGKGESLAENQIGLRKCEMAENQKIWNVKIVFPLPPVKCGQQFHSCDTTEHITQMSIT